MSTKQYGKLKMLPVNQTQTFLTPLQGEDTYVRTGTVGEGSCAYHSILHAYSPKYVKMNQRDRKQVVKKMRKDMADKFTKEDWEKMGDGNLARFTFNKEMNDLVSSFYTYIERQDNGIQINVKEKRLRKILTDLITESTLEIYKIIETLVPYSEFRNNIITLTNITCSKSDIRACKEIIIDNAGIYLQGKLERLGGLEYCREKYIVESYRKLISAIMDEAENEAYYNFLNKLGGCHEFVDEYSLGIIGDTFNRDIYFIDGKTRIPYANDCNNFKGRKSIVILWIGGVHYEIVGRLLPGNKIKREFEHNDPFIQKMYTLLCRPEQVSGKFPELKQYLPQEFK